MEKRFEIKNVFTGKTDIASNVLVDYSKRPEFSDISTDLKRIALHIYKTDEQAMIDRVFKHKKTGELRGGDRVNVVSFKKDQVFVDVGNIVTFVESDGKSRFWITIKNPEGMKGNTPTNMVSMALEDFVKSRNLRRISKQI